MIRHRLIVGVATLCLLAGGRVITATVVDNGNANNGGTVDQTMNRTTPLGAATPESGSTPLPAQGPKGLATDASEHKKPFTFSMSLREVYDDNVDTSKTNRQSAFETDIAPSILFDYPTTDSDFSARYTADITYYSDRSGNTNGGGSDFDFTHEFVATYRHDFSERFHFNIAEDFRYFTEPSLFENTGTPFRSGAYYANSINANLTSQWTPLFGTSTSYANTIVRYETTAIAVTQDNVENTGSQSFLFAILPKINLVFAGIVDDITYDDISRGYTSFTATTGIDWQALPSLSMAVRGGGTLTDTDQSGTSASPYAALTIDWKLGARSSLSFDYSHDVVPTDVITAEGQIADRINTIFRYDITPSITAHFQGTYTHGQYTSGLTIPGTTPDFSEDDFALDTGVTYHFNRYFDFDAGYTLSGVSSELGFRDYTRNQVYLGVRGTY